MDSFTSTATNQYSDPLMDKDAASAVDPFLVEALQNPRHRLTVLRMEQDIQQFLQNAYAQQFEFQYLPTSYLRLAAHRVSQHYGLQTLVQDNLLDGQGTKIIVRKLTESRYPAMHLSDIPIKQLGNEKNENVKIVLMQKSCNASSNEGGQLGIKCNNVKTVEERMEDYDKARARIFSSHVPSSSELEDTMCQATEEGNTSCMADPERSFSIKDASLHSRVAIFKDREKDLTDPDYDRSYKRYPNPIPASQSISAVPLLSMPRFHGPYVQYGVFPQVVAQQPSNQHHQPCVSYSVPMMNPFCANGFNQKARDPVHMQWPTSTMMYAQSYDHLRQTFYQAPYNQQPLSFFDYSQNC
ncbi:R3H domain-containing protein 1-like [Impatiens glandulifera]|uniref:R3H domain-containing protein 1-like n=1 Tax=Impatiens glandulifera TaxID=253017 RepID=UPI001FB0D33B|nr:R3H domain-containing protein 1-like [Impatiens glandulifera]